MTFLAWGDLGRGLAAAALIVTAPLYHRASAQEPSVPPPDEITFTSWTGPYMRSQMLGFVRPYEDETGNRVHVEHYNGGISEIRDQVESANVVWDVVDLTQADSLRACNEGLLENLEDITLPDGADGTGFREDFVEGALNPCGVGVIVWATAFAFDNQAFAENPPTAIEHFFDTETYPGPRAIRRDPTVIMEWALMADGVPRDEVYPLLETPEGIQRALDVMDRIKPGLQIWETGSQPARLLNSGEVTMSSIWATTGAVASDEPGANFDLVWDGRVIELDLFGIPKGTRNLDAAIDFISFASSSESLANMAGLLPNGPTRKSSLKLLPEDVLTQIPNGPAHEDELYIVADADWWSRNHAPLEEAFRAWLAVPVRHGAAGSTR